MSARLGTVLAALLAFGCAVGPDYDAPGMPAADWVGAQDEAQPAADWWSVFDDDTLGRLIAMALTEGPDIRAATARLDEARAARRIASADFWPAVAAAATYTRFEQSLESPGAIGQLVQAGLAERDGEFYNATVDASWELDLFGRVRRNNEAAAATLDAGVAEFRATELALVADTAGAYFDYLGATTRLALLDRNIELSRQTLSLTESKARSGLVRTIDALRAASELDATRARRPPLVLARDASLYRLGVLTGRDPTAITAAVTTAPLPPPPSGVAVGTTADLLKRRPDVIAAERRLAAATAGVGVATANFFPTLALNASYGFEAGDAAAIGDGDARATALVPFLRWPVFQGGRLRAALDVARARERQAMANYERSIVAALADAETAISAYAARREAAANLGAAAAAAVEAAVLARKLYDQGLTDFLTVLDAERQQTALEDSAAAERAQSLSALATLYKALGGGWPAAK